MTTVWLTEPKKTEVPRSFLKSLEEINKEVAEETETIERMENYEKELDEQMEISIIKD